MAFRALTVGWDPHFVDYFLAPIEKNTGIDFIHGLVGDASRVYEARRRYPSTKFVALSKLKNDPLPLPDHKLLASYECVGVSTIRSMVRGDSVLRHRPPEEALAYATLLARRIHQVFMELQPDIVIASYDSLHATLSLAVAKRLGIPWVAMAFPVIPDDLMGFCKALTPDKLVPIPRPVNDQLRERARTLITNIRSRRQHVVAYRPPTSLRQWLRQYLLYARNLLRRKREAAFLGVDRFTYPAVGERLTDLWRRTLNRICLPAQSMLRTPPEGRFVYYPFHMAPESMLDTWAPFYQDQLAFVAQFSLAIPADVRLVVKLHFSDPDNYGRRQLQDLMNLPRLHIAHPDAAGRDFIEKAALVIGIQGTACLEAALLGKPVLIFGDSPYQHFPRTERAKRPDELYEQIQRMLEQPLPSDDQIVEAYAAYLARYMPGRVNDWTRSITQEEVARLAACFRELRAYVDVPSNRANWYKTPPFMQAAA